MPVAEAVWFPRPREIEIRAEEPGPTGAADVRICSLVSGISAGSELLVYRGKAPADLPPDLPTVDGDFGLPIKFGYASVGRVIEAGPALARGEGRGPVDGDPQPGHAGRGQADGVRVGDLVFLHHPHQTEFVVPAAATIALPADLPPEVGVFTANLETAVTIVLDAAPRLSEVILVTGQGVVGLLVTMLLRRTGAAQIIVADRLDARRAAAVRAGADCAVAPEAVADAVAERSAGRGVDIAIEASGNPSALQTCIDAAAFSGTIVVASWYGRQPVTLDLGGGFHRKRLRLASSQVSTLDPALSGRWNRERRLELVTGLLAELPLADLITHRFPFHQAAAAYQLLDRDPEACLQVVLEHG